MKIKKLLLGSLISFGAIASVVSCDKNDSDQEIFSLSGDATGAEEVPAVTTSGSATLTGSLDTKTKQLNYTITWTGLSGNVVAAHFHGPADVGTNAPPIIAFTVTNNGSAGSLSGSEMIADTTIEHFKNGRIYYNLHTPAYPGGEIRAQVIVR
jgi:hypothetical protein